MHNLFSKKSTLLACLLLILLTLVFTFPLIFRMNSLIPGFHSTDETYAALWNFWWLKYAFIHHLNDAHTSLISAPFGMDEKSAYPSWNAINKWLTILTNNIFAYNLEALFSFFAAGLFMYCLVFVLTGNVMAGIFSGIIYAFCPYHFARAWQHLGLAQIQWMPLYILLFLKMIQKPNFKHAFSAALAYFLVFSFDFYYAYFMFIITLGYILFIFIYLNKQRFIFHYKNGYEILKALTIFAVCAIFLTLPYVYPIFQDMITRPSLPPSVYNSFLRPFEDLFIQSARPLSYLLPATVHPVFGKFTENFIGSSFYGESFTEHTLYLGWIPLILAFVAFRSWRGNRGGIKNSVGTASFGDSPLKEDFYMGFFILLTIVAWLFSQPPWWNIGPIKIFMPSFFMYKVAPMFRAYCRFGIVVILAVAVLAGFGLKFILERLRRQKTKIIITSLFCGLVLFEFWNYPPFKVINVSSVPEAYYWLKSQPGDFTVAEYPIDKDGANVMYMFFQAVHEKKIINGTTPGTYANKIAQNIVKLSETKTIDILKHMGVRYILVHQDAYLQSGLVEDMEELSKIPKAPGLRLIKTFPAQDCPQKDIMCVQKTGPIDAYEVIAAPIKPGIEEK